MLTRVEVRNRQGALLNLPLSDIEHGIIVAEIEGLDPVKATLTSSSFANQDGAQYYSSRREPRNIIFHLELEADYTTSTIKSIRNRLYGFFMPKTEVFLRFIDSVGSYVDIVGRVESFEAPLFTDEPVATLSLMCFDPDFFDPNPFTVQGVSVTGSTLTNVNVPYLGTVESGFIFTMNFDRAITYFSIIHSAPDGIAYEMDVAYAFQPGDILVISSVSGAKGVTLTRSGTISNPLYVVSPQSKWLELLQGDNFIRVNASAAGVPWSIQYVNRYGGL